MLELSSQTFGGTMAAIRRVACHEQEEGVTPDPQKRFIVTTSSLSKAACYMSYVKTSFTERWAVTFKPPSTSTLRVICQKGCSR